MSLRTHTLSPYYQLSIPNGVHCSIYLMSKIEQLLSRHGKKFQLSITHPLTNELCEGSLADYKLYTFLAQDLQYFQIGLNVMGRALSFCTNNERSSIILAKQIGFVAGRENDYFDITMSLLKKTSGDQLQENIPSMLTPVLPKRLPEVQAYIDFMETLVNESTCYCELAVFLYVMEKVYLGWAQYNLDKQDKINTLEYKHQEWIDLHSGPEFEEWVQFLADEVERSSIGLSESQWKKCEKVFEKTLDLEIGFFESCYTFRG